MQWEICNDLINWTTHSQERDHMILTRKQSVSSLSLIISIPPGVLYGEGSPAGGSSFEIDVFTVFYLQRYCELGDKLSIWDYLREPFN